MTDEIKLLVANIGIDYFNAQLIKNNITQNIRGNLTGRKMNSVVGEPFLGEFNLSKKDPNRYQKEYTCYYNNEIFRKYNEELYTLIKQDFGQYDVLSLIEACDASLNNIFNDAKKMIIQEYTYPPDSYTRELGSSINQIFTEGPQNSTKIKAMIQLSNNVNIEMTKAGEHIFQKYFNYIKDQDKWLIKDDKTNLDYCPQDRSRIPKCLTETTSGNKTIIGRNIALYPPTFGNVQASYISDSKNQKYILLLTIHNKFYSHDDLNKFEKLLDHIVANEDNVIFTGDFNLYQSTGRYDPKDCNKNRGYNPNNLNQVCVQTREGSHLLNIHGMQYLDLKNIYQEDKTCNNYVKRDHMKLFYKLTNYNITLDTSKYTNCLYHFNTSSHIMIPIILNYSDQPLLKSLPQTTQKSVYVPPQRRTGQTGQTQTGPRSVGAERVTTNVGQIITKYYIDYL